MTVVWNMSLTRGKHSPSESYKINMEGQKGTKKDGLRMRDTCIC